MLINCIVPWLRRLIAVLLLFVGKRSIPVDLSYGPLEPPFKKSGIISIPQLLSRNGSQLDLVGAINFNQKLPLCIFALRCFFKTSRGCFSQTPGFELPHLTRSLWIRHDADEGPGEVNGEISVFCGDGAGDFGIWIPEGLKSIVAWLRRRGKTYLLKWRWHRRLRALVPQHILNFYLLISFEKEGKTVLTLAVFIARLICRFLSCCTVDCFWVFCMKNICCQHSQSLA